jgi:hypothetical protein
MSDWGQKVPGADVTNARNGARGSSPNHSIVVLVAVEVRQNKHRDTQPSGGWGVL